MRTLAQVGLQKPTRPTLMEKTADFPRPGAHLFKGTSGAIAVWPNRGIEVRQKSCQEDLIHGPG